MRFASALLFVALTGSIAIADEAKPADPKSDVVKHRVPLRVVKMLPETRQVLLLDRNKGTHVVAEVGQDVDGYVVDEIDDDEVTLVAENGAEVILTAPARPHRKDSPKTPKTSPVPEDPYAEPAGAPIVAGDEGVRVTSATDAPADPYGDPAIAAFARAVGADGSPTPATAPATSTAPQVSAAATATPSATTPAPSATTTPSTATTAPSPPTATATGPTTAAPAGAPAPAVTSVTATGATAPAGALAPAPAPAVTSVTATGPTAPAGATAPAAAPPAVTSVAVSGPTATAAPASAVSPGPTTATLHRGEVDAALANFASTAATFRAEFTAQGLHFDEVATGSLLARAGLQKGDLLTAVDGQPLRSLDDAANLYARLPTARGSTLAIVRGGKQFTLRVSIQ